MPIGEESFDPLWPRGEPLEGLSDEAWRAERAFSGANFGVDFEVGVNNEEREEFELMVEER